jgi:uncharacterized protein (TIGR02145 family)
MYSSFYLSSSVKWGTDPWNTGSGGGLGYISSGYVDGLSARCVLDQGSWKFNTQLISEDTLWLNEFDDVYSFSIIGNIDTLGSSCYRWIDQEWDNVGWPIFSDSSLTSYIDTSIGISRRLIYCKYSSNGVEFDSIIVTKNPKKPFACGDTISYLNEDYPSISIGTQCWFQKNLNVGTMILGANDQTNNSILEKYCYNNDTANCAIYGGLYQWAEAVQYQNGASNTTSPSPAISGNVKGICPNGWHVPSDGEWCTLTTFLDSTVDCSLIGWSGTDAGGKLKSTSNLWNSPNTGATNSSGFSVLPGGARSHVGTFKDIGFYPYFWSQSEYSNNQAISRLLYYAGSNIRRWNDAKNVGFSIRCLKD